MLISVSPSLFISLHIYLPFTLSSCPIKIERAGPSCPLLQIWAEGRREDKLNGM